MEDTYQHNRMEPYAEAIGRPSQSAGPRRRTPKQLERKRAMDKAAQKLKREKDKSWKSQVQSNLRSMQEEIHSLREDVNRMLGGVSDSSKPVNTGRLTNYSRSETIPSIINVIGENTVAGGCSTNSPTSWRYTPSEHPPVLQETASTNLAILSNPSAPYRYDTHVAAESPFKHSHSDSPGMDAASTFRHQPLSNQPSDNEKSPGYSTRSIDGQSSAVVVGGLIQRNYVFPGAPSPFGIISQSSDPPQSVLIEDDHEPPVGCRCDPIKHGSYADCVEQSVFDALIRMHKWNVNENLPVISRSPALVDMLFLRKGENAITQLISKMLHRSGFRTLTFLFSAYILVYRVLRVSHHFICQGEDVLHPITLLTCQLYLYSTASSRLLTPFTTSQSGFDRAASRTPLRTSYSLTLCTSQSCVLPWCSGRLAISVKNLTMTIPDMSR